MAAGKGQIENICRWKGTNNLITAKTALQCRIRKAKKGNLDGSEAKTKVQYNKMHRLGQTQKGAVQKQAKGKGSKCKNAY